MFPTTKVYKNPPITEAVFDIQVDLPANFDCKEFEKFYEQVKDSYPTKELTVQYKTSIQVKKGEEPVTGTEGAPFGYIFKTADNKKIIQMRLNGFTFNKLKPYNNWEEFSGEAIKYWQEYMNIAKPLKVTRVGLRYINRIDIPLPLNDLKEYIKTYPEIAPEVPQELAEFFMRLVIPDETNTNVGIITEAIDQSVFSPKILPLIFDIDVFRPVTIKPEDAKNIGEVVDSLRNYKNVLFIKSITEKTELLFN